MGYIQLGATVLTEKLDLTLNSFKTKAAAFANVLLMSLLSSFYKIQISQSKRIAWPSNFRMDDDEGLYFFTR